VNENQLEELYQEYWNVHSQHIVDGAKPMAIAGVLMAQALTIYKTLLSEDEFNTIVDNISDTRDKVKKLNMDITIQ
jgi:hypothetical protein